MADPAGAGRRLNGRPACTPEAFLLSALLVTLWHLQWHLPGPFRGRHLETKDELVSRLIG